MCFSVSVLLLASVERFGVSRMRDFYKSKSLWIFLTLSPKPFGGSWIESTAGLHNTLGISTESFFYCKSYLSQICLPIILTFVQIYKLFSKLLNKVFQSLQPEKVMSYCLENFTLLSVICDRINPIGRPFNNNTKNIQRMKINVYIYITITITITNNSFLKLFEG